MRSLLNSKIEKMIITLNPQFAIRNESECSYIVKRNWEIDAAIGKDVASVTIIPPVIGYILNTIGLFDYNESLKKISKELNVSEQAIDNFTQSLLSNEAKGLKIGDDIIKFPQRLLIKSKKIIQEDTSPLNTSCTFSYLRPQMPITVNVMVTTKCTTNCCYCYAKRHLNYELGTNELVKFIKDCKHENIINLNLTGGDIFARKDWKNILSATKECGFNPFLSTKTPLDEEGIKYLSKIGIHELQFSLDSCRTNTLMELIQVNENYLHKVCTMFELCDKYKIRLAIRTVLCSVNSDIVQLEELYSFLKKFNYIKDWVLTPAFFSEHKKEEYKKYNVSNENLINVKNFINNQVMPFPVYLSKISECGYELQRFKSTDEYVMKNQACYANTYSISVLASGECTICEMLYDNEEYLIGNIRENSLREIWNSKKAISLYTPNQDETSTNSPCHTCNVFDDCKKKLAKKICYVDIAKTNVGTTKDLPDPRCPLSKPINVIL